LEEKGVIDREQKGILKDLIISGDNDLQDALDHYEQGDPSVLESMIRGGTLNNRAASDIDLLGDLDLDFLTMHDDHLGEQAIQEILQQQASSQPKQTSLARPNDNSNRPMQLPPSLPTPGQLPETTGTNTTNCPPSTVSPFTIGSDGIGELEFDGDYVATGGSVNVPAHLEQAMLQNQSNNYRSRSNSTYSTDLQFSHPAGGGNQNNNYRSRSNSTFSTDLQFSHSAAGGYRSRSNSIFSIEQANRDRSNSLFSALIGQEQQQDQTSTDYGRWMEARSTEPSHGQMGGLRVAKPSRRASAPSILTMMLSASSEIPDNEMDDSDMDDSENETSQEALTPKQVRAEEKRREKLEKKETRDREKLEKKEKREQVKLLKQKKVEAEEKEEYVPGSGRPRSMSDPNLRSMVDANGLLHVDRPDGWIGAYSPESRKVRIDRFLQKRNHRVWTKTVKYDVRKNFADSRLRVKGRFVKKEDELMMRELMSLT
jgi:hypothetical protein